MTDKIYALVQNGVVSNMVVAPEGWSDSDPGTIAVAVQQGEAGIGWSYDGASFTAPPAPAKPAPTTAQLIAYASDRQNAILGSVWTINVGTSDAPVNLTTRLGDRGQAAMMQLLSWARLLASPGDTQSYNMADGSPGPSISPDQAVSLAAQTGAIKSQTYAVLNTVTAAILASPPTITTTAQIDAAQWPTPTSA